MSLSSTPPNTPTPIEDPSVYLDDPNRKLLEIDTDTRQGPALFRWLTLGMEYLIGAILVALIVAVSSNVVGRSLFNHSLPWVDELARMRGESHELALKRRANDAERASAAGARHPDARPAEPADGEP